jgi:hypothetical protein
MMVGVVNRRGLGEGVAANRLSYCMARNGPIGRQALGAGALHLFLRCVIFATPAGGSIMP